MKRAILLLFVVGCSSAETAPDASEVTFPDEAYAMVTSDGGKLTLEVRTAPDEPPTRGQSWVEYRIHGDDGQPVEGLSLSVVPWMTDMGHGTSTAPVVTDEGGGRYVIAKVNLFMPGRWELRTTFADPVNDLATPTFQVR